MEIRPILSALLRQKTGPLLVALQVAISLAVLSNALFIVHERITTSQRPSGIAAEHDVGYVSVVPLKRPSQNEALAQRANDLRALRAIPGVASATVTNQIPMSRSGRSSSVRVKPGTPTEIANPSIYFAEEDFTRTLGLKIVQGRDLTPQDMKEFDEQTQSDGDVFPANVLVTFRLAKMMFPDTDRYVGRDVYFSSEDREVAHIVGVVDQLQSTGASATPAGEYSMVLPVRFTGSYWRYVLRAEPGRLQGVLRAAEDTLRKIAPAPQARFAHTMDEIRGDRYRNERAMAWMLVAVSILLLLITLSGIVGMTTLRVAQRRKQIGVRRALGATWADIVRYFVTENVMITTGGIAAGLLLAIALNRLLMDQLGMARLPLEYLAWGSGALWLLGVLSVYGPASRAAGTSPAVATRTV